LITVAVVIIATFAGVYVNLSRLSRDVEQMFYGGVYLESEGYLQPSINSQLERQTDAALGLAVIMRNYPELTVGVERLLSTRNDLLDAEQISLKGMLSINMQGEFYSLLHGARSTDLSERDLDAATQLYETFSGSQTFVARNAGPAYNDMASRLRHEAGFPANLISMIIPVGHPDNFAYSLPAMTYPDPSFVFP